MKTTIHWMLSTLALIGLAITVSYPAIGADAPPATKPDAANPDAKRLTFLGDQLSADEAAIKAINKALIQAGYHAAVANEKAANAAKDSNQMDRQGGAPIPWQQFYGRTARDFIMHDKYSPVYHQVARPDQFDYVYRANNNQIESAKSEVDALGRKVDALLARRRELESEQCSLWATIAFESIGNRDISLRPLYRDELKAKPSATDDNRPDGARVAAMRAATLYLRTLAHSTEVLSDRLESDQESAYLALRDTLQKAGDQLTESAATFADTAGVDPAEAKQMSDIAAQAKQIQALCKDVCEAFRKAKDADAAGEGEEQRKLLYRGTLQDSLFTFAEAAGKLDDMLGKMSETWQISGQAGVKSSDQPMEVVAEATHSTPLRNPAGETAASTAVPDAAHSEAIPVGPSPSLPAASKIPAIVEARVAPNLGNLNDRQIAEQVLQLGGRLILSVNGQSIIRNTSPLPDKPFTVVGVNLGLKREINDNQVAFLSAASSLKSLNLRDTAITDATLVNVVGKLDGLNELDLAGNSISTRGLDGIRDLTNLTKLTIGRIQISDLQALTGLSKLTDLSLWFVPVSDDSLKAISGLTNLNTLCLRGTRITDRGLQIISTLTNLTDLDLTNTRVTDQGMQNLSGLKRLAILRVTKTTLSDTAIKQALPNCQIVR